MKLYTDLNQSNTAFLTLPFKCMFVFNEKARVVHARSLSLAGIYEREVLVVDLLWASRALGVLQFSFLLKINTRRASQEFISTAWCNLANRYDTYV